MFLPAAEASESQCMRDVGKHFVEFSQIGSLIEPAEFESHLFPAIQDFTELR